MSAPIVTCACCGKPGPHKGRGLKVTCYDRHRELGTLHRYPLRPRGELWTPKKRHGKAMLARYAQLVSDGHSPARIAWELSVSERTVQRYAAAYAAQQRKEAA